MTNSYSAGSPTAGTPSGLPGFVPRRSSYASIVSGTPSYSYPRSGALSHLLNQHPDYPHESTPDTHSNLPRYDPRTSDVEMNTTGGGHGRSGLWGRNGQLPNFSSAFRSVVKGNEQGGYGSGGIDGFFIPSYLKGSKYMQTLESAHRSRSRREGYSAPVSQQGSLSTSASSANLSKSMPSHRGMTYDLIEKAPPLEDELLSFLPSRWSSNDKSPAIEITEDGLEIKLTLPKDKELRDHESCSVRADFPMPAQCGMYYFEVTILSRKREESSIGIGVGTKDASLSRVPGWEKESWGMHGDDGSAFHGGGERGKTFGTAFNLDDTIGCGMNFRTSTLFFTKNGEYCGIAFRDVREKVYPFIGMRKNGEHVRVNFGQSPFVFDIDGLVKKERDNILDSIKKTSVATLAPPMDETRLIQSLVIQYLTHEGYVETAAAFAGEVHSEQQALSIDPDAIVPVLDYRQDEDAGNRQRIRTAVLDGDIEKALKHTNAFYPQVLKDNEHIYFRLRCRRFIEMIRQGAEMYRLNSASNGVKKAGHQHNGDWYDEVINQDMDIDDHNPPQQASRNNSWDKMDTDTSSDRHVAYEKLLQDTLMYGQNLQAEFRNDPRREISKALNEAFALLAYQDPLGEKEVAHQLDISGRIAVAEELNSAILLSLGKSSSAAIEQVIQQTTVLLEDLQEAGGPGALINVDDFIKPDSLVTPFFDGEY